MDTAVQASMRVCDALAALRDIWSRWNEWHSSQVYYCQNRLPQLQADLSQCKAGEERAILLELRLVATTDEWAQLSSILANLDEHARAARRIEAATKQANAAQRPDITQATVAIKTLLAEQRFTEAEACYALIKAWAPGFDYRSLLHRYQEQWAQSLVQQVQTLLAEERFIEADQAQTQIVGLYTQTVYAADRAIVWQRRQVKFEQALRALLAGYQFAEADQLYQSQQSFLPLADYTTMRQHYQSIAEHAQRQTALRTELQMLLAQEKFTEADKYFATHPNLSIDEYAQIKAPYLQRYFLTHYAIDLDGEQSAAIGMPAHSLLVTARAGSGKTRVITGKAAYVIAHEGITLAQILLLTFNDETGIEMRNRMRNLFGFRQFENARTFHSLAHALIEPGEKLLSAKKGRGSREEIVQNVFTEAWEDFSFAHLVLTFCASDLTEESGWSDGFKEDQQYEVKRNLHHFSLRGESVKSRGEKYIADFLYEHGISYEYEQVHDWNDAPYHPDFTIFNNGLVQPVIIEYWAIDESDPTVAIPSNWKRTASDYREEMVKKRAYWQSRQIQLIELAPLDYN